MKDFEFLKLKDYHTVNFKYQHPYPSIVSSKINVHPLLNIREELLKGKSEATLA